MLASPIQSGAGNHAGHSAAADLSPAEAAADNTLATTSSTEQQKNLAINPESGSELFAVQLNEALIDAEQPAAAPSLQESESEVAQQQPEPNAEAWLLAMLDQQQVQLQARDNTASTHATAIAQIPAETVVPASLQLANPDIAREKLAADNNVLLSTAGSVLNKAQASPDQLAEQDLNKTVELPLKNMVNSSLAVANANAASVTESRAADSNTTLTLTSISVAMNSSATLTAQPAGTDAITDAGQLISPPVLNAVGDDSVQRSMPSQLRLHAPEAKWGEQLLHALRDNVQVQIQQRIQNATIRLDPPELGSLEIYLSHEAGRLNVHIAASQADVARLIQQTSERLRQDLAGPQFTQVNVHTSAEGQGGQQSRERHRFLAEDPILANEQAVVSTAQPVSRTRDVLVTV